MRLLKDLFLVKINQFKKNCFKNLYFSKNNSFFFQVCSKKRFSNCAQTVRLNHKMGTNGNTSIVFYFYEQSNLFVHHSFVLKNFVQSQKWCPSLLLGNNGLVEIDGVNLETGFDRWIQIGFPHHVCVVQGKHKQRFLDFARNLNITIVE